MNVLKQIAEILNEDLHMDNLFNLDVAYFNFIKPFNVESKVEEMIMKFHINTVSSTLISLAEFHKINLKRKKEICRKIILT